MHTATTTSHLTELRPGHASLLRHDAAEFQLMWARDVPRVDLHRGAVWLRATDAGPGIVVSCGESHIHLRSGAAVVERRELDALVVVASGRVSVTGTWPLPKVIEAGQGVAVTIAGEVREPRTIPALELAANPMVIENLVRDGLVSGSVGTLESDPIDTVVVTERPRVDGTPPPVLDLTDGAAAADRAADRPTPIVTGPDPRPDLVIRGGVVSVRATPSPLERAVGTLPDRGGHDHGRYRREHDEPTDEQQAALARLLRPRRSVGQAS